MTIVCGTFLLTTTKDVDLPLQAFADLLIHGTNSTAAAAAAANGLGGLAGSGGSRGALLAVAVEEPGGEGLELQSAAHSATKSAQRRGGVPR